MKKWIDIKGDVAEQMLRYAYLLHLNRCGDDAGAVVSGKWIADIFPNLPKCDIRNRKMMERLGVASLRKSYEFGSDEWMNYENVEELGEQVQNIFTLNDGVCPHSYTEIIDKLLIGESVAIHVLSPAKKASTCTHDYYNWAISGIRSWIENPHFVVVTDDEKWAKENLMIENADWLYLPTKRHELVFEALRHAKHNIISNSLASWWGAWLNSNPDKIVAAPKIWSRDAEKNASNLNPLYWTIVPIN